MANWTTTHFVETARIIRNQHENVATIAQENSKDSAHRGGMLHQLYRIENEFVTLFKRENSRFDEVKFRTACRP